MSRDKNKPVGRFTPTEQSLDFSERIAKLHGLPFDRKATEDLGTNLYEVMFAELVEVLDLEITTPDFHSGVYPSARAFSALTNEGRPVVALDMVFDFWIASLHHIVAVCTFSVPSEAEQRRIATDITRLFELFRDSSDFRRAREPISHYVLAEEYVDIIKVSSPMGRASLVFVMCHELAHLSLDHHGEAPGPEQELEADREAVRLFKQVLAKGQIERCKHIHIDPKVMCAPVVFTMILELFESWLEAQGLDLSSTMHPPASKRTVQLRVLLQGEFNDVAAEIAFGSTLAITGLNSLLSLPRPDV